MSYGLDIRFNGGDDISQYFQIVMANGVIADLTSCAVSAVVITRNGITLSSGNGLTITETRPDANTPHGLIEIAGSYTATLPYGKTTKLRFLIETALGKTISTQDFYLIREG